MVAHCLRCHAPDEPERLLDTAALTLETLEPVGPRLEEAMAYTAIIRKA